MYVQHIRENNPVWENRTQKSNQTRKSKHFPFGVSSSGPARVAATVTVTWKWVGTRDPLGAIATGRGERLGARTSRAPRAAAPDHGAAHFRPRIAARALLGLAAGLRLPRLRRASERG